ncbi:MAG: ATP-binding protein [Myxococcota bacterium]|nr:ATP-binding protein [Myxococcota bacterium]
MQRAFMLTAGFILGWLSLELFLYLPLSHGRELSILRGIGFFWIPIGVVFLHFTYKLLGRPLDRFFLFCLGLAVCGVVIDSATDLVLRGFERREWGVADVRGLFHTPMAFVPMLPTLYGLWLVRQAFGPCPLLSRPVLSLVFFGGAFGLLTAMALNVVLPNLMDIDTLPRFGSSALALSCFFFFVAVRGQEALTMPVEQAADEIFTSSKDGFVLLDADGRVARFNSSAKSLLMLTDSASRSNLESRPELASLLPELQDDQGTQTVSIGQGKDECHYSVVRTPLALRHGKRSGEIVMLRNISALKQAQQVLRRSKEEVEAEVKRRTEELRQAQKMEEIGRLAGAVAHDFNNLLGTIIGFANSARDDLEDASPIREDLVEILCTADTGRRTVQQLLSFSRKSKAQPVPANAGATIKEAIRQFSASLPPTIVVRSTIDERPCRVLVDSTRLQQVMINLLSNAAYAMQNVEGSIEVRMAPLELDFAMQIGRTLLLPMTYIRIEVKDHGSGMSQDTQEHLFEPFFSTKPKGEGMGLGLATAKGIIDSHGGALSVTSVVGVGSTFTIHLPLLLDDSETTGPEEDGPTLGGSERILLVDDEERVLRGTRRLIEPLGYSVEATTSGEEAMEWLSASPDLWDLLVADQVMPGLSGLQLAKKAKSLRPDLPVILITGGGSTITDSQLAEVKVASVLRKPIRKTDLSRAIRAALGEGRTPRARG